MSAVLEKTIEKLITVEEFYEITLEGFRGELVNGRLKKTMPTSILHGIIAGRIAGLLWAYILQTKLGEVLTAETGFKLFVDEKTVRVPDVSFLSNEKLALIKNFNKFYDGTPDLAVEVISPSESYDDVQEKLEDYLSAGVKMVWVIRPKNKTVTAYRTLFDFKVLREDDELSGEDVLPDFKCSLSDIFGNLLND
ncbi:MAG: Uma2 family endonuclease [Acidobacteriota bacterium]|nr:Uma2 family endonuclease [Acidobacteriota bacterium]